MERTFKDGPCQLYGYFSGPMGIRVAVAYYPSRQEAEWRFRGRRSAQKRRSRKGPCSLGMEKSYLQPSEAIYISLPPDSTGKLCQCELGTANCCGLSGSN
uniref:Uncharacterized protein n=1 Tax=Micrurus surinamensis TaxID=129470 RepID=A0A2D4Q5J0_MICSU